MNCYIKGITFFLIEVIQSAVISLKTNKDLQLSHFTQSESATIKKKISSSWHFCGPSEWDIFPMQIKFLWIRRQKWQNSMPIKFRKHIFTWNRNKIWWNSLYPKKIRERWVFQLLTLEIWKKLLTLEIWL